MQGSKALRHNMATTCLPPLESYTAPDFTVPGGACCTHAHVIPAGELSMVADRSYTPAAAPEPMYLNMLDALSLDRGVLVQLSVFGTDNTAMLESLRRHGQRLRGIAVVDPTISDEDLGMMHQLGVRGLRFNLMLGGGMGLEAMEALAPRMADLGWHAELLIDGPADLPALVTAFSKLPCPIVLDHMANLWAHLEIGHPAVDAMFEIVRMHHGWVKISGAYRLADDIHDHRMRARVRALFDTAPDRIVWGTDWPHVGRTQMPDAGDFLNLVAEWFPEEHARRRVLSQNPAMLYGFCQ